MSRYLTMIIVTNCQNGKNRLAKRTITEIYGGDKIP